MTVLVVLAFALVAAAGTAVVLSRDAQRQAITLSTLGLTLTVLFLVLQAPDVALSQLAIGAAVVPLMVMLTLREISHHPSRKDRSARS
jgi:energy-converting hydrogenase B subunit D